MTERKARTTASAEADPRRGRQKEKQGQERKSKEREQFAELADAIVGEAEAAELPAGAG
jgi:hypothetical protein